MPDRPSGVRDAVNETRRTAVPGPSACDTVPLGQVAWPDDRRCWAAASSSSRAPMIRPHRSAPLEEILTKPRQALGATRKFSPPKVPTVARDGSESSGAG